MLQRSRLPEQVPARRYSHGHGARPHHRLAAGLRPGAALAGGARSRGRNRPRCGRRREPGSPPRASARACSGFRTPTGSGRAARSSRPASTSTPMEHRGAAVDGDDVDAECVARVGPRPRCPAREPLNCLPPTVAGSTTTCRTGAARWTAASTPGPSPTECGWVPTSAGIVDWFVEHRLADGGWNCEWVDGSTRSSYHSTLNSLKGLLAYETASGGFCGGPRRPGVRAGVPVAAEPVPPVVDRRTGGAVGGSLHLPVPVVLQRAQRRGLLSGGGTCGRPPAGSADGSRRST